jgi:hypothetical protein
MNIGPYYGACFPMISSSVFVQTPLQVPLTVHGWIKNRSYSRLGTLALLGLAFCVFAWGLQYKLSLYDPPQAASHQIPKAKLLSKDQQSKTPEGLQSGRYDSPVKRMILAPATVFFIRQVLVVLNPPATGQWEQRANSSQQIHCAILNTIFVRPPPFLA